MDIEDEVRRRFVVWPTQGMAVERQEQRKDARIFSFESPKYNAGCRKFIAVGLDRFWQWYCDAPVPRHFYEIIQGERPCRPYFDLEFAKDLNPGLDAGEALRDFLVSLRCNEQVEELAKCAGPSTFTVLDAFMLDFLRQFTPSVAIRQWTLYIYRPIDSRSIQYESLNSSMV